MPLHVKTDTHQHVTVAGHLTRTAEHALRSIGNLVSSLSPKGFIARVEGACNYALKANLQIRGVFTTPDYPSNKYGAGDASVILNS